MKDAFGRGRVGVPYSSSSCRKEAVELTGAEKLPVDRLDRDGGIWSIGVAAPGPCTSWMRVIVGRRGTGSCRHPARPVIVAPVLALERLTKNVLLGPVAVVPLTGDIERRAGLAGGDRQRRRRNGRVVRRCGRRAVGRGGIDGNRVADGAASEMVVNVVAEVPAACVTSLMLSAAGQPGRSRAA